MLDKGLARDGWRFLVKINTWWTNEKNTQRPKNPELGKTVVWCGVIR